MFSSGIVADSARRRALQCLVLAVLVLLAATARASEVEIGQTLPALSLLDWQGRPTQLGDVNGKVVLIDFWASWCAHCRTALPVLEAMSRRYNTDGLTVVAIDIDSDHAKAEGFLSEHVPEATMLLWRDPQSVALARFGASGMPALYVVDEQRVVRLVKSGYTTADLGEVERDVAALLGKRSEAVPPPDEHSPIENGP
jgi:thiol-disulfide isomerase/thioredoxin